MIQTPLLSVVLPALGGDGLRIAPVRRWNLSFPFIKWSSRSGLTIPNSLKRMVLGRQGTPFEPFLLSAKTQYYQVLPEGQELDLVVIIVYHPCRWCIRLYVESLFSTTTLTATNLIRITTFCFYRDCSMR